MWVENRVGAARLVFVTSDRHAASIVAGYVARPDGVLRQTYAVEFRRSESPPGQERALVLVYEETERRCPG